MGFNRIIGNAMAVDLLRRAIGRGRLAHAYMLSGPEGIGKSAIAGEFAKALNCERAEDDACDACLACHKVDAGTHPDVHWYRPSGATRRIGVEPIKDLIGQVALMPFEGRCKVFVIVDADRMNQEAQNMLLKTLEEPPGKTILVLTTSNPGALVPTIVSRCQIVNCFPLPRAQVERYLLEREKVDPVSAATVSGSAQGRIGNALRLLDPGRRQRRASLYTVLARGSFEGFEEMSAMAAALEEYVRAVRDSAAKALNEADRSVREALSPETRSLLASLNAAAAEAEMRREVDDLLDFLGAWYRDLLLCKLGASDEEMINRDWASSLREGAFRYGIDDLLQSIDAIEEVRRGVALNMKLEFCFQMLFVKLNLVGSATQRR